MLHLAPFTNAAPSEFEPQNTQTPPPLSNAAQRTPAPTARPKLNCRPPNTPPEGPPSVRLRTGPPRPPCSPPMCRASSPRRCRTATRAGSGRTTRRRPWRSCPQASAMKRHLSPDGFEQQNVARSTADAEEAQPHWQPPAVRRPSPLPRLPPARARRCGGFVVQLVGPPHCQGPPVHAAQSRSALFSCLCTRQSGASEVAIHEKTPPNLCSFTKSVK